LIADAIYLPLGYLRFRLRLRFQRPFTFYLLPVTAGCARLVSVFVASKREQHDIAIEKQRPALDQPNRAGGRGETDSAQRDPQGDASGALHHQLEVKADPLIEVGIPAPAVDGRPAGDAGFQKNKRPVEAAAKEEKTSANRGPRRRLTPREP